ncbi:hypothetical protein GCM10027082_21870 [Comamonas humi]
MTPPEQSHTAPPPPPTESVPATDAAATANRSPWLWTSLVLGVATTVAIVSSALLWQRLNNIQQQLARQSADSHGQAVEARTIARQAEDVARDMSSRMSVMEARVGEVALQRGQLDALLQSLSRSRDDNLVVETESAVRFALQQAQLTGSADPLVSSLKAAQLRISRASQPSLAPLSHAIARDLDRIATTKTLDTSGILARLDDLIRQADELPLQNDVAQASATRRVNARRTAAPAKDGESSEAEASRPWWQSALATTWEATRDEARRLVRVRRIDYPDAALVSPDQAFFLRENLKLTLLNARLGLLARQTQASRNDLSAATQLVNRYFDATSRRTQNVASLLQQVQLAMRDVDPPRADDTLAALTTAAAGR